MTIEKSTSQETVSILNRIKTEFRSNPKENADTKEKIDSSLYVFSNHVLSQSIKIECTYEEMGSFLEEYIRYLSRKYNMAVLVTIGLGCQIETYKRVSRLCKNHFDYSVVVPSREQKPTIKLLISFFKSFEGEQYEIDIATRFTN